MPMMERTREQYIAGVQVWFRHEWVLLTVLLILVLATGPVCCPVVSVKDYDNACKYACRHILQPIDEHVTAESLPTKTKRNVMTIG
jgi:hypothetical protein